MAHIRIRSVLVVDDDDLILQSCRRQLENDGHSVFIATSTAAALRIVRRARPDLVISDLRVGGDNGIDLIRGIKQENERTLAVLMTGHGETAVGFAAAQAGADLAIDKPVSPREIIERMDGVVTARTRQRDGGTSLRSHSMEHVLEVLAASNGNISLAARRLGMHRPSLQRYLKKNACK